MDLTQHDAAAGECRIASLTFNAEQEEVLVGLSTGALYCLQRSGSDCSNIEEVSVCPSVRTRQAWTHKAWSHDMPGLRLWMLLLVNTE